MATEPEDMDGNDPAARLQALLNGLKEATSDEEREWLTTAFSLEGLTPALREAVWAAAVPHWFDRELLGALLGAPVAEEVFEALLGLSFVEPYPGRGHAIHERTRGVLLARLWKREPERYRALSRRAAAYTAERGEGDEWRIETIYHRLVGEPERGEKELISSGWEWQNSPNFAYDTVEALARAAREHLDGGRLGDRGAAWTLFWEALIDRVHSRFREAKAKLQRMPLEPKKDPYTAACCIRSLGDAHLRLSEVEAARSRYEEALPLYRSLGDQLGEANCLWSLGDVGFRLSEMEMARSRYEEALPLYRSHGDQLGEANCLISLGDVHFRLDGVEGARSCYEAALLLNRSIDSRLGEANCLGALGELHFQSAEYGEAGRRIEQAREIYESIGAQIGQADSLRLLGALSLQSGDYPRAREQLKDALARFEDIEAPEGIAECWEGFAALHEAEGQPEQAAEAWGRAAELYETMSAPLRAQPCRERAEAALAAGGGASDGEEPGGAS